MPSKAWLRGYENAMRQYTHEVDTATLVSYLHDSLFTHEYVCGYVAGVIAYGC